MIITSSSKNKRLLGDNNKNINKRLLSSVDLNNSVLVIDFSYYCSLIANKLKYNNAFGQKWASLTGGGEKLLTQQAIESIFEPIVKLKRLIFVEKIALLIEPVSKLPEFERELFKLFSGIVDFYIETNKENKVSSLYSLAIQDKQKYIILTDDVYFWSICSQKAKIYFCIITKNNGVRFYFDKFGLEYISSLIGTNKLVNKLRLGKLKYVNLQYLFLMLLYVKFKQVKANETLDFSDKKFLGAKGMGLSLLTDAHREIAYYFLTKPDIMEIFLTSSITHFTLNLSRLQKLTNFDITLLSAFAAYYNACHSQQIEIEKVSNLKMYYKAVKNCKLYNFQGMQPKEKKSNPSLPQPPEAVDISAMDTSMAIDSILKGLSW